MKYKDAKSFLTANCTHMYFLFHKSFQRLKMSSDLRIYRIVFIITIYRNSIRKTLNLIQSTLWITSNDKAYRQTQFQYNNPWYLQKCQKARILKSYLMALYYIYFILRFQQFRWKSEKLLFFLINTMNSTLS